jgi:hypothetical protein
MIEAMPLAGAAAFVPLLAAALAASMSPTAGATPDPTNHQNTAAKRRATLMPISTGDPFKLRGSGFHARERVRVSVTPTAGEPRVRRIRATGRGTFVLAFSAIQACGGVEGVAAGSRGSHASFQYSSPQLLSAGLTAPATPSRTPAARRSARTAWTPGPRGCSRSR